MTSWAPTYAFEDRNPKRDLAGYGTTIKDQLGGPEGPRAVPPPGSSGCMMGLLLCNPKHFRALMATWLNDHARTHPTVHPEYAPSAAASAASPCWSRCATATMSRRWAPSTAA